MPFSNLEKFISRNGAKHYGVKINKEKITLIKSSKNLIFKKYLNDEEQKIQIFQPDFPVFWRAIK